MRKIASIFIISILIMGSMLILRAKDEKASYGKVTYLQGRAIVKRNDKKKEKIKIGTKIYQGNLIKTYAASRLNISLPTGIKIQIKDESVLSLDKYLSGKKENQSKFKIFLGALKIKVEKLKKGSNNLLLETPTAVVGVRGTLIHPTVLRGITRVAVLEGSATVQDIANIGISQLVNAGFSCEVRQGQAASIPVLIRGSGGGDDTSAPLIIVIRPIGNLEHTAAKNYTVRFIVTDENLDKVRVNGVGLSGVTSGVPISHEIILSPGKNTIIIQAEDVNMNSAEVIKEIQYIFLPPAPPKK